MHSPKTVAFEFYLGRKQKNNGGDNITGKFYLSPNSSLLSDDRFNSMAGMVYADILRKERKWYQHPKWHIHHWSIRFHPIQQFKKRYIYKCCVCGKRGTKTHFVSNWTGTKKMAPRM